MPAATIPLSGTRPARIATIERPRTVIISISGKPNAKINGRAIKIKHVSTIAPKSPPKSEDINAADNARAAWPFFASGKPSKTVACDAEEPGMPNKTEAKVSDVGTTAIKPTISAKPDTGSIPNMNGRTRLRPAIPPSPGNTPMDKPSKTPATRNISCCGWNTRERASPKAGMAVANISMRKILSCAVVARSIPARPDDRAGVNASL